MNTVDPVLCGKPEERPALSMNKHLDALLDVGKDKLNNWMTEILVISFHGQYVGRIKQNGVHCVVWQGGKIILV